MKRKSVTTIRHLLEKQGVIFLRLGSFSEGGIGGYPKPQYREKKRQKPQYRIENR